MQGGRARNAGMARKVRKPGMARKAGEPGKGEMSSMARKAGLAGTLRKAENLGSQRRRRKVGRMGEQTRKRSAKDGSLVRKFVLQRQGKQGRGSINRGLLAQYGLPPSPQNRISKFDH